MVTMELALDLNEVMLTIESRGFVITLSDDPAYTAGSADNTHAYDREIRLTGVDHVSSKHAVVLRAPGGEEKSCILLGGCGPTTIHEHSAITDEDTIYVACGDSVVALALPALVERWARAVDSATCFGLHALPRDADIISHGELSVARFTPTGEVRWTAGGADIFTGPFAVDADVVRAEDWNGSRYTFDLTTGRSLSPEV